MDVDRLQFSVRGIEDNGLGHGDSAAHVAMISLNFTGDVDLLLDGKDPDSLLLLVRTRFPLLLMIVRSNFDCRARKNSSGGALSCR